MNLNKVMLIGRLGKDPEVKYLGEGESSTVVCKFSLATSESYKKNDEWHEATEWHDIVMWRKIAERAGKNLKKGSLIYLEGKLTHRYYEDKEGNKRYVTEVNASFYRSLEKKSDAPVDNTNAATVNKEVTEAAGDGNDDLPF
jgi:single-strand DNA-binding protein